MKPTLTNIEKRVEQVEAKIHPPRGENLSAAQMTDAQLLRIIGLGHRVTDEELQEIATGAPR